MNLPLLSQYPLSALSSPTKIIYPLCLARAMWHLQILPGRWGPWAKSGGQSWWRWEESPTGFFPVWAPQLPEQLSLTESHGLVAVGAGRQEGPAGEGQKVPEVCTAAALLRQAAGDPRPKRRDNSTELVTQGSQWVLGPLSVGPWQHPSSLGLSLPIRGVCGLGTQRNFPFCTHGKELG